MNLTISDWTETENQMTCVERSLEYTKIEQENPQGLEIKDWPSFGNISIENVTLSYDGKSNNLENINLKIESGEKFGIVGRTGAGKSSLISLLLRMYDIEGKVKIDDVDIKTVSLEYLRSKISIIPQEPFLFSGTIRDNIDPFHRYTDEDIWNCLSKVNMKPLITSLDQEIKSGNVSFSIGQKQLLCISRAILQRNKIVILDEATANTDPETEKAIYGAIQENFADCTVLKISHSLETILSSDRVAVMQNGRIVESDTPRILIENSDSLFYKMMLQSGLL